MTTKNKDEILSLYKSIKKHYLLKRKIGSGSFGVVYLAEHSLTREKVAIKFEPVSTKRSTQS